MNPGRWSEAKDGGEWDRFMTQHQGSIFHTWAWRKVLESSESKPFYLVFRDSHREILAACPFVYAPGRRFLHLDTLPNTFMAGPIVAGGEEDTLDILGSLPRSVRFSLRRPVMAMHVITHLERIIKPMKALGFEFKEDPYGLLIVDLHETPPESIWNHGFEKHDRQAVKYHEGQGSEFLLSTRRTDYERYLELKEGPEWNPYGERNFFSNMESKMGESLRVGSVTLDGNPMAAVLALVDPVISTVHLLTIRYTLLRNIHSPVTVMNWKLVKWANDNGFRYVDFGPWLAANAVDPSQLAYRLKRRFEASFVPRVKFTVRPSGVTYSIARKIILAVR